MPLDFSLEPWHSRAWPTQQNNASVFKIFPLSQKNTGSLGKKLGLQLRVLTQYN